MLAASATSAFAADVQVTDNISVDTTWTADNEYIFGKPIYVVDDATLTIEPGTTIYGFEDFANGTFGSLIITRGAKIMADGTPSAPIVFTALEERDGVALEGGGTRPITSTDNMKWGGVILLGKAVVNGPGNIYLDPTNTENPPTFEIEGFPAGSSDLITYGGIDDTDSSGVLRFVSIRYGGFEFDTDEEINGLTLGAVGSGTTIEFIEVYNNSDDGVEFFGGTVDVKYMVMALNEDESFDWDQGWRGKGQFWLAVQKDNGVGSNYGAEMDGGDSDPKTLMPFANPVIYNATYIGSGVGGLNGQTNATWRMKDNTGGFYYNSVFTDFNEYAIRIDDADTENMFTIGELGNGGNVFGTFGDYDGTVASLARSGSAAELGMLAGMDNTNVVLGDELVVASVVRETAEEDAAAGQDGLDLLSFDPRILDLDGPAYDPATMIAFPVDEPFYSVVDHKGAVGTFNWLRGWTYLDTVLNLMPTSSEDLDTDAEFSNISTRALVGTGENEEMNIGFVIEGSEPQTVYITGKGPSLPADQVANPLADPKITLVDPSTSMVISENSSWKESSERGLIEATTIPPSNDLEAAIVATLAPGAYTVLVESEGAEGGISIGEVFLYR